MTVEQTPGPQCPRCCGAGHDHTTGDPSKDHLYTCPQCFGSGRSPVPVCQEERPDVGNGSALAGQHVAGIERMGSGSRPTGAAVAGEGAAGTFDALRPWLRALEILDRAA